MRFEAIRRHGAHWLANITLAVGLALLVKANLAPLGFILIAASKWQIVVGGWRLWFSNLRDNAVDLIVAVAVMVQLILHQGDNMLLALIAGLYLLWLLVIKPLTGMAGRGAQALIALFLALNVIFLFESLLSLAGVVSLAWLIGLISADHFLRSDDNDDPGRVILTFAWALVVAQAAWLMSRWSVMYAIMSGKVLLPQAALILAIAAYVFGNIYMDHRRKVLRPRRLFGYLSMSLLLFLVIIIGTEWTIRL